MATVKNKEEHLMIHLLAGMGCTAEVVMTLVAIGFLVKGLAGTLDGIKEGRTDSMVPFIKGVTITLVWVLLTTLVTFLLFVYAIYHG